VNPREPACTTPVVIATVPPSASELRKREESASATGPDPRRSIRSAKDTGLANLPFHDTDQNRIWLAITALAQDLLAWCARLALPATAATYEPKRLRLRILAVAGRIVRTARRRVLHIDPAWPWADVITTAHARLRALPAP
jgi:hypothetical protein